MAFEGLADKLGNAFKKLKNKGKLLKKMLRKQCERFDSHFLRPNVNIQGCKGLYKQSNRACCRSGCYAKSYSCTDGC